MEHHESKYPVLTHTLSPLAEVKFQSCTFYESSHVTYHTQGNEVKTNMQA